ncbi:JNK1/MAPK8-associated membrane protein homolog [Caenorhabditis elegans]|uniref:Isoform b of JNK1/MAPK8-associated membrane protein homolog n=1 Tax=Caenorhabditis elegans TaxID=6239 RepID=G5EBX4-2|nr:JNK1/MAPK8-associated membrane protein homolog [Caenorhabditis elegans]VGM69581.1 JNK1/MAPK8-associated membrane protein homolog [Caenorhabditis elegans]
MSSLSGHASTIQPSCLGFCGRTVLVGNYSEDVEATTTAAGSTSLSRCGPCSFGYRNNAMSICESCDTPLQPYDWMYLLFIALLPLLLHMQFIRIARKYCRTRYYEVSEYLCVILENVIACVIAVLIYPPRFTFFLNGCSKTDIKEWYPACYNPRIGYTKTMRCTYEVVFPLYSITFIHHLILIGSILVLRSTLYCVLLYKTYNGKPFYAAIVSVPILAVIHAVLSGVVFYTFPYILLIGSLWAMCFHLALEGKRPLKEMIVRIATSPTHLIFLSITMLMLSFGVIAIIAPLIIPETSHTVGHSFV